MPSRLAGRADQRRDSGFTLVELLVVVIVVGVLSAVAVPVFLRQRDKAAVAATKSAMHNQVILIVAARENQQAGLKEITTSVCSFCTCRDRTVPLRVGESGFTGTPCGVSWRRYVDRLAAAAGEPVSVVEKMATDGWGYPLIADENEGELGRLCGDPTINDLLYSFGPDQMFATTSDNIVVRVPATGACIQT